MFLPTSATIINIPDDYGTIQEGIDAGSNGDTVLVQPDIYYENFNFNGHNIVLGSWFLTTGDTSYISQTVIDGGGNESVIRAASWSNWNNEINGLTLGGVGNQTIIEYIEIFANNDDGVEFFGGMPNTKYIISAYCKDDAFDYDQGYRGKGQFWLAVQDPETGDRLGEFDGADDPENGGPFAIPEIYNATFIGNGNDGKKTITFRANGGGKVFNSIFINQSKGIDIEIKESLTAESSYKRLVEGDLKVENNIFFNIADNSQASTIKLSSDDGVSSADLITAETYLDNYIAGANNTFGADPGISAPSNSTWSPIPTGDVTTNVASYPSSFFTTATYKGAFEPGAENWAAGWTLLFE